MCKERKNKDKYHPWTKYLFNLLFLIMLRIKLGKKCENIVLYFVL